MKIAYLYPQWKVGRHSYAMDVIGQGLAREIAVTNDVILLSRGQSTQHGENPPLRLVGDELDQVLSPLAYRLWSVAQQMSLIPRSRPISSTNWAFPGYALASARVIREIGADIAHVHIYEQLIPMIRRYSPETRIVLHVHDHSQLQQDERAVRKRLEKADLVVACSNYMANAVAERFPVLTERVMAIPNSVPGPWPQEATSDESGSIVFVGRLSPEKGVHVLVEAFNKIGRHLPTAKLTLVGPDAVPGSSVVESHLELSTFEGVRRFYSKGESFRNYLEALVDPELRERVEFVGELPNEKATKQLSSASLLVMPSIWNEPFGMPVLEGMIAGIPVVATRIGAFPEVVKDRSTGLLVEPGNVAQLAEAVESILSDSEMAKMMGAAGRDRADRHFGWQGYVDAWSEAYAKLE